MAFKRPNGHAPGPLHPNANFGHGPAPEPLRPEQQAHMSRAAVFEDEKKRIQETCFGKEGEKGSGPVQSYITHIRVEEDGAYPSEPPPPEADPSYKKQRVIIAAVKQSGRVYLHKARENDDRSFQIGKTWPLEELSVIESFSSNVQRNGPDQTRARLGGDVGFVITIAKPYFWKAKTLKEKVFFIGSIVKIYRKYTNGNLPKLVGFDPDEERQLIAASEPPSHQGPPPPQQRPPNSPLPVHPNGSGTLQGPPSMPYSRRPNGSNTSLPGQDMRRTRPSDGTGDQSRRSPSATASGRQPPPSPGRHRNEIPPLQTHHLGGPSPAMTPTSRSATPNLRSATSQDSHMRARRSQDHMRSKTPEPPPRIGYPGSRSNLSSPAPPEDRHEYRLPSSRHGSENRDLSRDPAAKSPSVYGSHENAPSSTSIASSTAERWRPPGAPSRERPHTPNESIASNISKASQPSFTSERSYGNTLNPAIPERRRPTLEKGSFSSQREAPDSIEQESMPQPLRSKKAEPPARPPQEDIPSQLDAKIPGAFTSPAPTPPPPQSESPERKRSNLSGDLNGQGRKSEDSKSVAAAPPVLSEGRPSTPENKVTKEDPTSPSTPSTPGALKPGLGSMVGKRLGESTTTASRWKKATQAAAVASAFKPRAGGAGARLLAEKNKPTDDGPDGVTGVVPAPSVRAGGTEGIVERLEQVKKDPTPELQVTGASPSFDLGMVDVQRDRSLSGGEPPVITQKPLPKLDYQYDKALGAIGVDRGMFGGQGQEYEAALAEFGWSKNILQTKTVDLMEADLRREIARLEAGPWLGQETENGGHKDAGVEGFEKVLDKAIAECDEMERLLSLYGVEFATLNDDIALIESQASGLQVTTANQKLLQIELQRRIGAAGQGHR